MTVTQALCCVSTATFRVFILSGSIFSLHLSPRLPSRQTNPPTATTTKIVLSDSTENATSAGLGSCLQDYNMICEHVNTSWIKQRSLHASEQRSLMWSNRQSDTWCEWEKPKNTTFHSDYIKYDQFLKCSHTAVIFIWTEKQHSDVYGVHCWLLTEIFFFLKELYEHDCALNTKLKSENFYLSSA